MSNISVYTTPKLEEDSVFINNFLDDLLDNYYGKKYGHGNTLLPESFSYPTLQDLIQFSYPNYYFKSVGLYCNRVTTEVVLVYKANLHNYLLEALEHKHSRLIISLETVDKLLRFVTPATPGRPVVLRTLLVHVIAERLSRRCAYKVNKDKIFTMIGHSQGQVSLGYTAQTTRLVYKPELDSIQQHSDSVKLKNADFLTNSLGFFNNETERYGLCIRVAFSLMENKDLFSDLISERMQEKLISRADEIVKATYLDIDTLRKLEDVKQSSKKSEALEENVVIDYDTEVEEVDPRMLHRELDSVQVIPIRSHATMKRHICPPEEVEVVEPKHPGLYPWEFKWLWLVGAVCFFSVLFLTWCFT